MRVRRPPSYSLFIKEDFNLAQSMWMIRKLSGRNYSSVGSVVSRMKNEIGEDAGLQRRVERIGRQLQIAKSRLDPLRTLS